MYIGDLRNTDVWKAMPDVAQLSLLQLAIFELANRVAKLESADKCGADVVKKEEEGQILEIGDCVRLQYSTRRGLVAGICDDTVWVLGNGAGASEVCGRC